MYWEHVIVGDFVHVSLDEIIPADILLIRSSDPDGICFVNTSNLDGETNLKQRRVPVSLSRHSGVRLSSVSLHQEDNIFSQLIIKFEVSD